MRRNLLKLLCIGLIAVLVLSSCVNDPGTDPGNSEEPQPEATAAPWAAYDDEDYVVSVYPKPVSITISENPENSADGSLLTPSDRSFDSIFTHFGFNVGDGGLPVEIKTNASFEDEQYTLVTKKESVVITASGQRGVYTAVSTLRQLCKQNKIAAAEVSDKPDIPVRGVIEGFYGVAWTHEFRLALFDFMGAYKLNTYIYAPKDDPKHRSEWRKAYTGEELDKMKELITRARDNSVSFVYAISPGVDIDLGSGYSGDFAALTKKCESMYGIGVRDFAILLDDITTIDAEGHAKLVNDFQNKFIKTHEGCSDLIMITTEYCDAFITNYTKTVGSLIQPEIRIMWTGEIVVPSRMNEKTLSKATRLYNRKLFIWWNYPVNDTMGDNLFMGPCESLGVNIGEAINALVSNPMNQGYASMLPLLTTSDFLWNQGNYDKEESLIEATKKLAPTCAEGLYTFADLCRACAMNGNRSSLLFVDEVNEFLEGDGVVPESLKKKLEKAKEDLGALREKGDEKLLGEINRWLTKAETMIEMALKFVDFENAQDPGEKTMLGMDFAKLDKSIAKSKAVVSADVLVPFLNAAKAKINEILGEHDGTEPDAPSVSTNLGVYMDYSPENAVDGSEATFFWSNGAPKAGNYFTYDLGVVSNVTEVSLTMGASGHEDDYLKKGVIEYSTDGVSFTPLCNLSGRKITDSTAFKARYIRVRCTAEQTSWLIISELSVTRDVKLPAGVTFDGSKIIDLSCIFDRNLFTYLDSRNSSLGGKKITIDTRDLTTVELMFIETGSVKVTVTDAEGNAKNVDVSTYTHVDVAGKASLTVTLGGSFCLSEIVMK